jgi:alanine-glyoxylate transaminase / serine-glyoxylate transaminase / serine-pyruvate transaminase
MNDLTLMAALSGVEMGLRVAAVPHAAGGAQVAMEYLTGNQ